jgi:acetylornithine/LysW-gamma-L-lysine aminotransferase
VCSSDLYGAPTDLEVELARMICEAVPSVEMVRMVNSGTEAVEGAIKFARLTTGRKGLIAAKNGFHGRTLGALSATWRAEYREPFEPLVPGFSFVAYNDPAALEQAIGGDTAAVILEGVQGEGGVRPGNGDYLRCAQALCRERGALFIVDEVQTGFGRTGRMFAGEHHGLEPDILCLAKAIAGGLPMGAVLFGPRVGELSERVHGSTFGGNPLACAAGYATLKYIIDNDVAGNARSVGHYFLAGLEKLKEKFQFVTDVRGRGLLLATDFSRDIAQPVLMACLERGLLVNLLKPNSLRFMPPLIIGTGEVDEAVGILDKALFSVRNQTRG